MSAMSMAQALNSAMDVMLARDPDVLIFGRGLFSGACSASPGPAAA